MAAIGSTHAARARLCYGSAPRPRDSELQRVRRRRPGERAGGGVRSVLPAVGPAGNLLRNLLVMKFWSRFFLYRPQVGSLDLDRRFHLKTVAAWSEAGQWIEVHAHSEPRP